MKRISEILEISVVREEWVIEGIVNEMSGVGRDVVIFVVVVESKVEMEEILEVFVFFVVFVEYGSEVIILILVEIDFSRKSIVIMVGVLVNFGCNGR